VDGVQPFFLTGERRMGKSSVLKQFARLLRLPLLNPSSMTCKVTGDTLPAQRPSWPPSPEVYTIWLTIKGMLIRELTYDQLREKSNAINEAVVYHHSFWSLLVFF